MAKQHVVAHATKYTASNFSSGGLERHIDRKHIPENARAEDQDKNFHLVSQDKGIREKIEERLAEGYTGKRAIRKDAVRSVGVIFSGSHEQMKKIEKAGLIEAWAKDTYQFAADRWGKENIVRATVHMDEKTPHMHIHFVPLIDGRLSAKKVISRGELKKLQEDYPKVMARYGLERGIEGSKAKHITTKQYYQRENEIKQDVEAVLKHPDKKEIIEQLLKENEQLTNERRKAQEKKLNPDKRNQYEKPTREVKREQNQPGRGDDQTKRTNPGFKI